MRLIVVDVRFLGGLLFRSCPSASHGRTLLWLTVTGASWRLACAGRLLHPDEILADAGEGVLEVSQ